MTRHRVTLGVGGVPESDVIVIASWSVSEYFGAGREKKSRSGKCFPVMAKFFSPSWKNFWKTFLGRHVKILLVVMDEIIGRHEFLLDFFGAVMEN